MENTQVTQLIELLKFGRKGTLTVADSVPESHRYRQLAAGKATPAWLLGHLSSTMDRIVLEWILEFDSLLGDDLRTQFAPAHAGGRPPTADPGDYPAWDTLKDFYIMEMRTALEGLAALNDGDLARPLPGAIPNEYRTRLPNIGTALKLVVSHDAYHRGQMGLLAKLD